MAIYSVYVGETKKVGQYSYYDGAPTATSSNTNIFTCLVGATGPGGDYQIAITGKSVGSATMTVKTDYRTETHTVNVTNPPQTAPTAGTATATATVGSVGWFYTVNISWQGFGSGTNNPIGIYELWYYESSDNGTWGGRQNLVWNAGHTGSPSGSYIWSGGTPGKFYKFEVVCTGATNASLYSTASTSSLKKAALPTTPEITSVNPTEIYVDGTFSLTHTASTSSTCQYVGYYVDVYTRESSSVETWNRADKFGEHTSDGTTINITPSTQYSGPFVPTLGRQYKYRVCAYDKCALVPGNYSADSPIVTVVKTPVSSIDLSLSDTTVYVGGISQITATVMPPNATYPDVTITSSDDTIATLVQTGTTAVVTGISPGSCYITATADGVTERKTLTVVPVEVDSVVINNSSDAVLAMSDPNGRYGATASISVDVSPSNATYKDKIVWEVSNTEVASIAGLNPGTLTLKSLGTCTLKCTVDGVSSNTISVSCIGNVLPESEWYGPTDYDKWVSNNSYKGVVQDWWLGQSGVPTSFPTDYTLVTSEDVASTKVVVSSTIREDKEIPVLFNGFNHFRLTGSVYGTLNFWKNRGSTSANGDVILTLNGSASGTATLGGDYPNISSWDFRGWNRYCINSMNQFDYSTATRGVSTTLSPELSEGTHAISNTFFENWNPTIGQAGSFSLYTQYSGTYPKDRVLTLTGINLSSYEYDGYGRFYIRRDNTTKAYRSEISALNAHYVTIYNANCGQIKLGNNTDDLTINSGGISVVSDKSSGKVTANRTLITEDSIPSGWTLSYGSDGYATNVVLNDSINSPIAVDGSEVFDSDYILYNWVDGVTYSNLDSMVSNKISDISGTSLNSEVINYVTFKLVAAPTEQHPERFDSNTGKFVSATVPYTFVGRISAQTYKVPVWNSDGSYTYREEPLTASQIAALNIPTTDITFNVSLMPERIKFRRGNRQSWIDNSDMLLFDGQPGFERDTYRLKVGNGADLAGTLPYIGARETYFERSGKDAFKIFTIVTYYKKNYGNNTPYKKSTLSGGTAPKYTTRTVDYYDTAGNVVYSEVYTLQYDSNGNIVGEVRLSGE